MGLLDTLLDSVRRCCEALPDRRTGANRRYTMAEISLAAFSVFFTQSPSFLAHQRHLETGQGRSNCQTLFGLANIPTDNHIRAMLDPVLPDHLFPVFADTMTALGRTGVIGPQEGHDKQDWEGRAVRRWLERHGAAHARLNPIYLGDDL